MQKIDYTNKNDIMVGYIDRSDNVVAVETGWKTTYKAMPKILINEYPTKEDPINPLAPVIRIMGCCTFIKNKLGRDNY